MVCAAIFSRLRWQRRECGILIRRPVGCGGGAANPVGPSSEDQCRRSRWRALDAWTAWYRELRGHRSRLPGIRSRPAKGRGGDPLCAVTNLLSCHGPIHRRHAEVGRTPVAGQNIACRVAGPTVAVFFTLKNRTVPWSIVSWHTFAIQSG
jgi:hypothetical protein